MISVQEIEGGYGLFLKDKAVQSPKKKTLVLPCQTSALFVAQNKEVLKLINTAVDHVAHDRESVVQKMLQKIHVDLLCYRAAHPTSLVKRQSMIWDPLMDHFQSIIPGSLSLSVGVSPQVQDEGIVNTLRAEFGDLTNLELVILHELIALYDSLILAVLHFKGKIPFETLWQAAILDECYLMETWGQDPELIKMIESKRRELLLLDQFLMSFR